MAQNSVLCRAQPSEKTNLHKNIVFVALGQHGLTPLGTVGACCALSVLQGLKSVRGVLQNLFALMMVRFRFVVNFC